MIYFHHPAPHSAFDKAIIAASHRAHVDPDSDDPLAPAQGIANAIKLALPFWTLVAAGVAWLIWR